MSEQTTALARRENSEAGALMQVSDVKLRLDAVHALMAQAMVKDGDFGAIPGTGGKPTLLKPGAEKLCTLFRLSPTYVMQITDMGKGHREYITTCTLTHIPTDKVWGQAAGSCSTMESKYRWRKGERKCPQCGAAAIIKGKAEFGGGWLCFNKKGGCGAKFVDNDTAITGQSADRVENPDIADQYNTILKMATKRALVAAVLITTGASALFTQDVEDYMDSDEPTGEAPQQPQQQQPQQAPQQNRAPARAQTQAAPRQTAAPQQAAPQAQPSGPGQGKLQDVIVAVDHAGSGERNGTPWNRYVIKTKGGAEISTFSDTLKSTAEIAMQEGEVVELDWVDKGRGKNLQGIYTINAPLEGELV